MKRLPRPAPTDPEPGVDPYPGFTGTSWDENSTGMFLEVMDRHLATFGLEVEILADPDENLADIEDFWWRIIKKEKVTSPNDHRNDIENNLIIESVDRVNAAIKRIERLRNAVSPTKDNLEKVQHDLEALSRVLQTLPR